MQTVYALARGEGRRFVMCDRNNQNTEYERCKFYYEKAIEGRNKIYESYNHWVNLWAIFTGALFVGYYNVKCDGLQLLLSLLGIVASICWLNSGRGYYWWLKSWISIVQRYEKKLNELASKEAVNYDFEKYGVYSKYINTESDKSKTGISTQRVTFFFIKAVVGGWDILAVKNSFNLLEQFPCSKLKELSTIMQVLLIIACLIVVLILDVFIYRKTDNMKSDLRGMKPFGENNMNQKFLDLCNALKFRLLTETSSFANIDKGKIDDHLWISDKNGAIGSFICHYEIRLGDSKRLQRDDIQENSENIKDIDNKVYVEFHIEADAYPCSYQKLIDDLRNECGQLQSVLHKDNYSWFRLQNDNGFDLVACTTDDLINQLNKMNNLISKTKIPSLLK